MINIYHRNIICTYKNKKMKLPEGLVPHSLRCRWFGQWPEARRAVELFHTDGDQAVILVKLLQSPMSVFLCKKWEGAYLAVRAVSRKHQVKRKILLYYSGKRKARNLCTWGNYRERGEIHEKGGNRLAVRPLQSRRADSQHKEWQIWGEHLEGTYLWAARQAVCSISCGSRCPGHNGEQNNEVTALTVSEPGLCSEQTDPIQPRNSPKS